MKIYISGKISGTTDFRERFKEAEKKIIDAGHEAVNPVELLHEHDLSWESYMKEDIKAMMDCDAVFMIGDWNQSEGARIEHNLAWNVGLKIASFSEEGLQFIQKQKSKKCGCGSCTCN